MTFGSFIHPEFGEVRYKAFGTISPEDAEKWFNLCQGRPDNPPRASAPSSDIPFSVEGSCETFDQEHQLNNLIGSIFEEKEDEENLDADGKEKE